MSSPATRAPAARRGRARSFVAVLVAIAIGLASRSGHPWCPAWFVVHAGDVLWASCLYFFLALLRPNARPRSLLLATLLLSFLVELSQLLSWEWLNAIRSTTPGRLVLGQGWQLEDLPRYLVGGLLAATLDVVGTSTTEARSGRRSSG